MLVSVAELTTYMDVKFTLRQVDAAEYVLQGLQSELEAYLRRPIEVTSFVEEHVLDSSFHGIPMSSFLTNQDTYRDGQNGEVANSAVDYALPLETLYFRNTPVIAVSNVKVRRPGVSYSPISVSLTNNVATITFDNMHPFSVGSKITSSDFSNTVFNGNFTVTSSTPTSISFSKTNANIATTSVTDGDVQTTLLENTHYMVRRYGIDYWYGGPDDKVTISYTAGFDGASIPMFRLMILRAATREMQNMHDDVVGIKDLNPRSVAPVETGFMEKELLAVKRYRRVRVA